jgi:transposase, IS5 family
MMMAKNNESGGAGEGIRLETLLDMKHALVKLTKQIDWSVYETAFGKHYAEDGRPGISIRVMVGLHYLKYVFDESDESVVARWNENPYWQYVCGCETFQHELPCHPSSLSRWRKRVGVEGMEVLLKAVLATAMRVGALKAEAIQVVNADTTVQAKVIAFPTDAQLYHKARRTLVRQAKADGIALRQSYTRLSKSILYWRNRYAASQKYEQAAKETLKLQQLLGRVMRDIERSPCHLTSVMQTLLATAHRIHQQKKGDKNKVYSMHAPEVECIAKGKANQKYEFGCKVAVTTTAHSNWIVGIQAQPGNPYDGATLKPALEQVEYLTAIKPAKVIVDLGYRGGEHQPIGVEVLIASSTTKVSTAIKKLFQRRSAIEPIIGHAKHDHGLERNHLAGTLGDKCNALLVGCGFNLAKLLHFFAGPSASFAS